MGVPAPATVETTTDDRAVTLKALARREQLELARRYDWPSLILEYTFNTVVGQETYSLTNSIDKVLRDTAYNENEWRRMRGSLTPAEWRSAILNNNSFLNPSYRVRLYGLLPQVDVVNVAGWSGNDPSILTPGTGEITFNLTPVNKFATNNPSISIEIGATYRITWLMTLGAGAALGSVRPQVGGVAGTVHTVAEGAVLHTEDIIALTTDPPKFRTLNSIIGGPITLSSITFTRVLSGITRSISLVPVPTLVETVIVEYKTKQTAFTVGLDSVIDVPAAVMSLDNDTTRLDESLIELGIKWRWLKSRGLDYGEEYRTYTDAVDMRYAQDINLPSVPLAPCRYTQDDAPITNGFVPDRGYGP